MTLAGCAWLRGPCEVRRLADGGASLTCDSGGVLLLVVPAHTIEAMGEARKKSAPAAPDPGRLGRLPGTGED